MKNDQNKKDKKTPDGCCLTIGDVTYKTAGNILFSESEKGNFLLAESFLLNNLDQVIHEGILENGMQAIIKKASAVKL